MAINAFFVAFLKVPSIIVTLGTMMLARGIAQVVTQGAQRNTSLPDVFGVIGNMAIPATSIKISVLIMLVLVFVAFIFEKKTVPGRRTYLIGANSEAARLSGVKVTRHLTSLFILSALLAGITGILLASEFKAGVSNRATGYEFDALVVALLGGVSINGGRGLRAGDVCRRHHPLGCDVGLHRAAAVAGLAVHPQGFGDLYCDSRPALRP